MNYAFLFASRKITDNKKKKNDIYFEKKPRLIVERRNFLFWRLNYMAKLAANSIEMFGGTLIEEAISRLLSRVINVPQKWNAFLKWSTLSRSQAIMALSSGTFPEIDCMNTDGTISGCFKPSQPNRVFIFRYDIQNIKFEKNYYKRYEILERFERTLLHELVHWGRELNKNEHLKYSKINGKFIQNGFGDVDDGKRFELEAYPSANYVYMPTTTSTNIFDY